MGSWIAGLIPCPLCGKCFANQAVIKVHVRDVHENKGNVYTCEFCNKESKSINGLRRHISVYHRNKTDVILPE